MLDDPNEYDWEDYEYLDFIQLFVERIVVTTKSGDFYGIEQFCVDIETAGDWYKKFSADLINCGQNQIRSNGP